MEIDTTANPAGAEDTREAPVSLAPEATVPGGEFADQNAAPLSEADNFDGLLAAPIDEEEVEYEGAKYKVPAPLKEAFLRQQDYAQKSEALAEQRRGLEVAERQIHEARSLSATEMDALAELHGLNKRVAEFNAVDWTALDHSDPKVQQAKGVRDELVRKIQLHQARLNEHFTTKSLRAQQEAARERAETDVAMSRIVKDWGPGKRGQFEQFAIQQGIPPEIAGQAGPAELRIIRLAMIGAQAEQQRTSALKAAANAATKPVPELGASTGSGSADPDGLSPEDYRAWRARQQD